MTTYIFQNVNLDSIRFINGRNDVEFIFLDSYKNSGKLIGELICKNVSFIKMDVDTNDDTAFPVFVCDVSISNCSDNNGLYLVKFEGSICEISVMCSEFKTMRQ